MQIYAHDPTRQLVHAAHATRKEHYTCPACQSEVRVRQGIVRQPHFYHPQTTPCALHGKSLTHLQIQYALQRMLASERVHLEHPFPSIGRIADVMWPAQKIVFEVQVSPISGAEVRARCRDYTQAGYQVVWILHDRRFNRFRITAAEIALRFSPHYFTNINALGKGFFYDQYAFFRFKRSLHRSKRFLVHFKRPTPVNPKQIPRHFPQERKKWKISFEGDLFHRSLTWHPLHSSPWYSPLIRSLRLLYHLLLEKTTY
jgi:competence protein CoiA